MKKITIFLLFGLLCQLTYSQSTTRPQSLPIVQYNSNIKAPLTSSELSQIKEVYGDYAEKYVLNIPQRLKDVKNILRNRVEIKQITNPKEIKSCPLLSEVSLFDNYNRDLKRDQNFNPTTFNPLKYNFEFYSPEASMYKVDNTNYYIIIKSQHQ